MEAIDYSSYTFHELIEASESIDRELFPERAQLLDHTIEQYLKESEQWAQTADLTYPSSFCLTTNVALCVILIIACAWMSIEVYVLGQEARDIEQYLAPFYIIGLIGGIFYYRKHRKDYQTEFIKTHSGDICFSEKGHLVEINWQGIEKVTFERQKHQGKYFAFYYKPPFKISQTVYQLDINRYEVDIHDLERFIMARTTSLNIPYENQTEVWRAFV